MFMFSSLQAIGTGVLISGMIASAFSTYNYIQEGSKLSNTKSSIEYMKAKILQASKDIDNDGMIELINPENKVGLLGELPVKLGSGTDSFGRKIIYCAVDKGSTNATDAVNYISGNGTAGYLINDNATNQNPNVLGYIISKGKDGIDNSSGVYCTSTWTGGSYGDDIVYPIGIGEANHYKLYAGTEGVAASAKNYNSARYGWAAERTAIDCNANIGLLFFDKTDNKLYVCKE